MKVFRPRAGNCDANGSAGAGNGILLRSISRLHIRAHHSRRDTGQFLARLVVNNAEPVVGPGRGQIARPASDGALKISFAFERFDFAFVIAEALSPKIEQAEGQFTRFTRMIRREGHQTGYQRFAVLRPGRVAVNRHHDGAAFLPKSRFQPFHQLNSAEAGGLLHRKRTAVREAAKDSRATIAVTQFGIECDNLVWFRFEIRKVRPREFEFNLHALSRPTRSHFQADNGNSLEVTGAETESTLNVRPLQTRPVTVHRAGRGVGGPGLAAEISVLTRVEIPFHAVAFPEMGVVREISWRTVQRS